MVRPELTLYLTPQTLSQGWESLPNGIQLLADVDTTLREWWPRIFGYHLLKMGAMGSELTTDMCKINHSVSLYAHHGADVIADFSQLPFNSASIDAVLMPLILEFQADPYRILREADRVLISGGYLIICGINPFSCAYLGKLFPKYQQRWPWQGRFFMPARVRDWLGLLGYQLVHDSRVGFYPFLPDWQMPHVCGQWQRKILPRTGLLYVMVARKIEAPFTPIVPKNRQPVRGWQPAATGGFSGRDLRRKP